jgi:hypothetical protein
MRTLLVVPLLLVLVLIACEDAADIENRCRQGAIFRQDPAAYYQKCVECGGPEKVQPQTSPSTGQMIRYQCR